MSKKNLPAFVIFLAFLQIFFASETNAQMTGSRDFQERFIVQSVRSIFSAEMTYQATVGAGNFGDFTHLRQANMIDAVLAGGEKYGYRFSLLFEHATATSPSKFSLKATPRSYPKTGRRSFYIDETGEMRGADKQGAEASTNDPIIDDCASFGIYFNERCVLTDLRVFWSAEMTYITTVGAGAYGNFAQLQQAGLINSRRGSGTNHGYNFSLTPFAPSPGSPAFFTIQAIPANYGVSGRRSFYIDPDAVIRGGDKQGQSADRNDPPIEY